MYSLWSVKSTEIRDFYHQSASYTCIEDSRSTSSSVLLAKWSRSNTFKKIKHLILTVNFANVDNNLPDSRFRITSLRAPAVLKSLRQISLRKTSVKKINPFDWSTVTAIGWKRLEPGVNSDHSSVSRSIATRYRTSLNAPTIRGTQGSSSKKCEIYYNI